MRARERLFEIETATEHVSVDRQHDGIKACRIYSGKTLGVDFTQMCLNSFDNSFVQLLFNQLHKFAPLYAQIVHRICFTMQ